MPEIDQKWLQPLCEPIGEKGSGEDPFYSDDFYDVKEEIGKLSQNDFPTIQSKCEKILVNQGKDIRVLAYLCFARTQQDGVLGFAESLRLLVDCFKNYYETIHPNRENAKITALRWLDNQRLLAYLRQQLDNAEIVYIDFALQAIDDLNQFCQALAEDYPLLLGELRKSLEKHQKIVAPSNQPAVNVETTEAIVSSPVVEQVCHSEQQLTDMVLKQITYLHSKEEWLRAAAFARSLRWGNLRTPPHQDNVTRLAPPRANGINALEQLINQGEPKALFLKCEELLLENRFHLYLDLQYYAAQAAKNMGRDDLALFLELSVQSLLRRAPLLSKLYFSDKTPFASQQCQTWLNQVDDSRSSDSNTTKTVATTEHNLNEVINSLRAQVADKDLSGKIHFINALATRDRRQHFQQQLALSRFCVEEQRHDLAIPLLERLSKKIEKYHIADWEPALAVAVWGELRNALKDKARNADKTVKPTINTRIEQLFGLICQTDVATAISAV